MTGFLSPRRIRRRDPAAATMKPAQMVVSLILLLPLSLALVAPKKVTLQWYAAGW